MSYIGNNLTVQQYAPNITYFSGNASTTAFTLPYAVVSAAQIIVTVENVIQNPTSAFTVSGTTLTFTSAPPTGTNNIWVEYTSLQTSANSLPSNPSIVGDLTTSGGVYAKTAFANGYTDGIVVDYTTGTGRITVGTADGISFYNGGPNSRNTLGSIPSTSSGTVMVSGNMPAFGAYPSSNQSITANVWSKIAFQTKEFDTNNCFDNVTNYRFTPNVSGYYQINLNTVLSSTVSTCSLAIYKNGSLFKAGLASNASLAYPPAFISCLIYLNGSTDYLEFYVIANANQSLQGVQANTWVNGSLIRVA